MIVISYIALGIRLLILAGAFAGIGLFFYDKWKVSPSFLPITVFGMITMVLFFAGLWNVLDEGVVIVTVTGWLSLGVYGVRSVKRRFAVRPLLTPSVIFFVIASVLVMVLLRGVYLDHYDNFSHWAVIVRDMFHTHALPTEQTQVEFRNYPPGAALFIYYVCRIVGYCESYALIAQGFLIIACVAVLFCKAKITQPITLVALLTWAVVFLTFPMYGNRWHLKELLVDGLLGYVMTAAIVIIYVGRDDPHRIFWPCVSTFSLLVLVKDSGKVFLFVAIAVLLLCQGDRRWNRHRVLEGLVLLLLPLTESYLWKQYVVKAYPSVDYHSNKFVFSPWKIKELFNNRPAGFLQSLPGEVWKRAADFRTLNTRLVAIVLGVALIVLIIAYIRRKNAKTIANALVFSTLLLAMYVVMLIILYAFLFTPEEAVGLDSFDRYYTTAVIVVVGVCATAVIYTLSSLAENCRVMPCLTAAVAVGMVVVGLPGLKHSLAPSSGSTQRRYNVQRVYAQADSTVLGAKTMFYIHRSGQIGWTWYAGHYESGGNWPGIATESDFIEKGAPSVLDGWEYLLVGDGKRELFAYLEQQGVLISDSREGDIYRIMDINGQLQLEHYQP